MKRILIVEDSPTQAQQIEALLGTEYEVTVARSGEQALERIEAQPFDLVVSDIMMPGITGYELCRRIKASSAHKELPVILLTSLSNPMDIVRGLEAGADNYITKPYEPAQLRARVRRVVDQQTMRRSQRTTMGVNISFLGSTFTITSEKEQILDVLLSAVEDTVRTNRVLEERQRELANAHSRLEASARESARAARISEERARALMQNAADAIFLLDSQGTILEVNSRAVSLVGQEAEKVLYRPLDEFIVATGDRRLRAALDRLDGEGQTSVEGRVAGSGLIVELSGSVTRLDGEEFSLVIAHDVTERRRVEEELRRSERQFAEAQQIAKIGSWEWRPDEGVVESSEELDRMFGIRFREVGNDWPEVVLERIDEEDRERASRSFEALFRGKQIDLEYGITDGAGNPRTVHARSERVSADDEPAVIRGTMQDITERKQVERRTAESEQMLRTIFEASPIAIITLDTQGRVRSWNHAAESMFGWAAPEVIGEPLPYLPPDEEASSASAALIRRVLDGESIVSLELRRLRRDGTPVDVSLSGAPLRGAGGEVIGAVGLVVDITEKKRAAEALYHSEEQLRHAQRMEAIGRLTGGIAHDFNNMLTAIQGTTQLLLMDYGSDKALSDELREIDRAASRAADLTRQLLAFSRKQPMQPKVLDLNALIEDMRRMLARLVGENVRLRTQLDPDLPPILADPGQMEQIVMNLVVNARDAMDQYGELSIETGMTEASLDGASGRIPCVALRVTDTGSGIEPGVIERIFDPFFTTKPAGGGTGLGLSTVYGIVQQNNGRIEVESEPGKGTSFTILLPAAEEGSENAAPTSVTEPASGSETVLLVEDDDAIRKLAGRVLRRNGYMVLEASSGPEAIALADQFPHSIQMVVSDMVMPGMSGRELVDQLAARRPDLRVLFISGYSEDSVRNLSAANRRAGLLEKPFTADAFAAKVREILDVG